MDALSNGRIAYGDFFDHYHLDQQWHHRWYFYHHSHHSYDSHHLYIVHITNTTQDLNIILGYCWRLLVMNSISKSPSQELPSPAIAPGSPAPPGPCWQPTCPGDARLSGFFRHHCHHCMMFCHSHRFGSLKNMLTQHKKLQM